MKSGFYTEDIIIEQLNDAEARQQSKLQIFNGPQIDHVWTVQFEDDQKNLGNDI